MLSKNNNRLSKISRITKNNTIKTILAYDKSLVCKYLLISISMPNSINLFQIKKKIQKRTPPSKRCPIFI